MNLQKNIRTKGTAIMLLTLSFLMYSCQKEEQAKIQDGAATVMIKLLDVVSTTEGLAAGSGLKSASFSSINASAGKKVSQAVYSEGIQTQVIPFSEDLSIVATLTPEDMPVKSEPKSPGLVASAAPRATAAAAATPSKTPLEPGVMYTVLVYDNTGAYVDEKTYIYGEEANATGFVLDGGETYTFVAYSVNSKTEVPNVTGSTLSTASLNNVNEEYLLYFKKNLTLTRGDNYLDIILKHQFSQITTTIELSDATVGNITSINSTTISPTHNSASINLSDGAITYGTENDKGASVVFNEIAGNEVRSITGNPTSIISPITATGKFSIGSITVVTDHIIIAGNTIVNSHTKEIELNDLRINPGRKYNLNLTFVIPCTEVVDVSANNFFDWNSEVDGKYPGTKILMAPGADFGFMFDWEELDNSFNMTINGKNLITHATHSSREVQFQTNDVDQVKYPQNIQFIDSSVWEFPAGANRIPDVWAMTGTPEKPVIRLVISPTGKVSMYGSKESEGELYPLVLKGGFKFNDIVWHPEGENTIVVSQVITGPSVMKGSGFGKKIVSCITP